MVVPDVCEDGEPPIEEGTPAPVMPKPGPDAAVAAAAAAWENPRPTTGATGAIGACAATEGPPDSGQIPGSLDDAVALPPELGDVPGAANIATSATDAPDFAAEPSAMLCGKSPILPASLTILAHAGTAKTLNAVVSQDKPLTMHAGNILHCAGLLHCRVFNGNM